jgi:serine acetyltransferase
MFSVDDRRRGLEHESPGTGDVGQQIWRRVVADHVKMGAGCAAIGDLHVGDHARVGALAVVLKSVPEWVVGNSGRVVRDDEPVPGT